jgi:hypothetical protein
MAKGWESKSVEDQVAEFESRANKKAKVQLTYDDAQKSRQREVLTLSRSRIQSELETCAFPRRREQLTQALLQIEAEIATLASPPKK